jgi:hypothetical protein
MPGLVGSNLRRQINFQHGSLILVACSRELFQVEYTRPTIRKRRNGFLQLVELWEVLMHEEIRGFVKCCNRHDCILFYASNEKFSQHIKLIK